MMNAHTRLARLREQYASMLKGPNINIARLRRIRDQIIKLEFDLGVK